MIFDFELMEQFDVTFWVEVVTFFACRRDETLWGKECEIFFAKVPTLVGPFWGWLSYIPSLTTGTCHSVSKRLNLCHYYEFFHSHCAPIHLCMTLLFYFLSLSLWIIYTNIDYLKYCIKTLPVFVIEAFGASLNFVPIVST